ncbi:MAG: hypothetical protein JO164_02780 [Candidatus Eremiobacteraeota bacterium]|nr:hypothetical protein [Candidatus Eremiobacteraeota bacterium]
MKRRARLERGLTVSFTLVISLVVAMIPLNVWAANNISSHAAVLRDTVIRGQLAYFKVAADANTLRAASLDAATSPDAKAAAASLNIAKTMVTQFPEDARVMEELTKKDPSLAKLVDQFKASSSAYDFAALRGVALLGSGKRAEAQALISGSETSLYDAQRNDGDALLAMLNTTADTSWAQLQAAKQVGMIATVLGALFSIVIAIGAMLWFRRSMLAGIGACLETFEAMGRGDLARRMGWTGNDLLGRIGHAIDELGEQLGEMIGRIQESAGTVLARSSQQAELSREVDARVAAELGALAEAQRFSSDVNGSAATVAENADRVAGRVGDIASSVSEMVNSIKQIDANLVSLAAVVEQSVASTQQMSAAIVAVAGNADQVRSESASTEAQVREGRAEVAELADGMRAMSVTVSKVASEMQNLDAASRQIGAIIGLIDEISDQTNLLALNAAIEAARAGEHGRGFAVVAEEVRKLAEKSAVATKEIGGLITDIQRRTDAVLKTTGEATTVVRRNTESAEVVDRMIDEISTRITEMAELVGGISSATAEQARASAELARAGAQMGQMTQSTAAAMREQAVTSNQILERVAEIEEHTRQVASASEEQRRAIDGLGKHVVHSSELGRKNAEAVAGMRSTSEEVRGQAVMLGRFVEQFDVGADGGPEAPRDELSPDRRNLALAALST